MITHSVSITNNDPAAAMLARRLPDYAEQQQRSMIDIYLVDELAVTVMALYVHHTCCRGGSTINSSLR